MVKEKLGLTPTEYKNEDTYYFFPPFSGESLQSVTVLNEILPCTLRVLFYHSCLINIESTAINTFLEAIPNYNGRIWGRNGKQNGNSFYYELYLSDTNRDYKVLKPHGFEISYEIPYYTSLFAISTVKNEEQKINAAWDYLYTQWLQNSMFEYTDEPYYEEYILKDGKPFKLKLFLPICKRNNETKISLIKNPKLYFITAKVKGYNAEKIASQTVMDYLTVHYPYLVKASRELYLSKDANTCICGVGIHSHEFRKEMAAWTQTVGDRHNELLALFL